MQEEQNKLYRFLRWSEKYTKTDMLYLAKGGFWLTFSTVLGVATALATSIVFANWLPEETYGVFRYVLAVLPILTIPTLLGINAALTRAVAQGKESTLYPALSLKIRWGMWGTAVTIAVAAYYYLQGDARLSTLFLIAAVFIPLMEPFNLFIAFLTGQKNFKLRAYYGALTRVIPSIILILIVFFTNNIFILVSGYFLSYTLIRIVAFRYSTKNVSEDGEVDHGALQFGKHLSLIGVLNTISISLDSILIFHFGGASLLAGYYLALVPFKQTWKIFSSLSILALPKLSLQNKKDLRHTLPPKVWKIFFVVTITVLAYMILAPFAFSLMYPKYIAFVYLSVFFMLQLLFFPTNIFYVALVAQGEKNKLYSISIISAVTRITLLLILTPLYGIWGAASAIVITSMITGIVKTYTFYRLN